MLQNQSVELSRNTFNRFLGKVFMYMAMGVVISAVMAYGWLNVPALQEPFYQMMSHSFSMYIVLGLQIGLVFLLRGAINRESMAQSMIVYVLYAICVSITFALVGLVFNTDTIYKAFVSAVILFGSLTAIGLTTKVDLSKFSGLLFGGLVALIITMLVNAFIFKSSGLDLAISVIGLILFLGITAFDVQKLKALYAYNQHNPKALNTFAVYGAFELYLDFINIFLYLLRLFGRDD